MTARSDHRRSKRAPGRKDLVGWRAYVTAPAPNGISVTDIADQLLKEATARIPSYAPVVGSEIREGRRYVDLTFSFIGFHQSAEVAALLAAAPIFASFGMPVERIELEPCEP